MLSPATSAKYLVNRIKEMLSTPVYGITYMCDHVVCSVSCTFQNILAQMDTEINSFKFKRVRVYDLGVV